MGKNNKANSKAAEKKKERLEMEKRMRPRVALVKAANGVDDPMENLPSFKKFNKNGLNVELSAERVTSFNNDTKEWIMEVFVKNMKDLYEKSDWGWNDSNKREELFDDRAWYLMARNAEDGSPLAYAHFRFDMDYDDEVLYVYEIQLDDAVKRQGLGTFMMQILDLLAVRADMRKIMVTVFKHNPTAQKFFKEKMRYEIDETCPLDDVYEQYDYQILSKFNKRKLAREASEESSSANADKA